MQPSSEMFKCPVCGMADDVRKVSSIVDAGTSSQTVYHSTVYMRGLSVGGYGTASGTNTSTTKLAEKLSPPSLPKFQVAAPGYNCLAIGLFSFLAVLLCSLGLAMIVFAPAVVIEGLVMLLGGGIIIAYLVIGSVRAAILRKNMRPAWEQAMVLWDTLYYCARNDVVFVPGSPPQSVESSKMRQLLFP